MRATMLLLAAASRLGPAGLSRLQALSWPATRGAMRGATRCAAAVDGWAEALAQSALSNAENDDEADDDAVPLSAAERRRKRDRADKAPSRLGKAGLKGFVPSLGNRDKVRPTLDDVERISRGDRARQRGVGSRGTPHRLNADERDEWERAKPRGWLTLAGRGYRSERKGSPLLNIWRQRCDASKRAAVWVELGAAGGTRTYADGSPLDACVLDLAPLRHAAAARSALAIAARAAAPFLADGAAPALVGEPEGPDDETLRTQPIWNVPFHEYHFEARSRADAKAMAAAVCAALAGAADELQALAQVTP
ncbi:hypothetical protein T492DRAFT_1086053 [Pavlovales sp. CCMP2436]|nr:hypothetical protein T492DRAFT_1086053 [Pavlovales sp. CCMP2436]